jgi:hypothetical protein
MPFAETLGQARTDRDRDLKIWRDKDSPEEGGPMPLPAQKAGEILIKATYGATIASKLVGDILKRRRQTGPEAPRSSRSGWLDAEQLL